MARHDAGPNRPDRQSRTTTPPGGGIISLFARHATAPNLLMLTFVLIGLYSLTKLNRQFFPDLEIPIITVNVPWPGASADDVEKNILDVLEPELRFIENVDQVISYAREGNASVQMEFFADADMQKAQSDVEQAVAGVTTLPEEAETPVISRVAFFDGVAKIAVSGPFDERALKDFAKRLRDGLLNAGIDKVVFTGARDEEIRIKVREEDLRRLDLTLDQISQRVRENTQDQPAGVLEGDAELQLRASSERKTPEELAKIEIKALEDGQKIFLGDVADIETQFDRDGIVGLVDGKRAVELTVQRSLSADTLEVMDKMNRYLETARAEFPRSLTISVYDVRGKFVAQRLGILITNGLQGLALVLITLFIFLNARVAFWTAAGIPIALMATMALMWASGQSLNMVSMFGLIMMLGIIVDDAIVVGEHAAVLEEQGVPRHLAAEQAGLRMMAPVTAATLTTIAAFLPITLMGGRIGDILIAIPLVATAALIASLIECFLILPGHLRHGRPSNRQPFILRRWFDAGFDGFRSRVFGPFVDLAFRWRYTTVAVLAGGFILAVGMLAGGRVNFVFFPNLPPDNIEASVYFAPGVPQADQIDAINRINDALLGAEKTLVDKSQAAAREASGGPQPVAADDALVVASFATIGKAGRNRGDNLAQIDVQLVSSEQRVTPVREILKAWRAALPNVPGVERVAIAGRRGGPPGRDVDVRLQNAPVAVLKKAAEDLKVKLTGFPGASGIDDDLPYGKRELVFELTPRGLALGFNGQSVGRQIRNAFEGAIATRYARDDEEITVRVMREQELDGVAALQRVYLTTPSGERVPLTEVVTITERQTFALIIRRDGVRTVAVTADLDTNQMTTQEAIARLEAEVMPELTKTYNVTYRYAGRDEERRDSFADLQLGGLLVLAMIYIILAWVFSDYWKPFAVMLIIPFGFVGAVVGHYVMGFDLSIISLIGLLGLSGILVNDSIVLVSRLNERLRDGDDLEAACVGASRDRFRAVLLTSITTIAGLVPLMFETSRQAQFLIPLAVTIVFGVAAATILVLILVPSLIGIGNDIGRAAGAVWRLYVPQRPEPKAPQPAE